mgnify:CR=1 FL=1
MATPASPTHPAVALGYHRYALVVVALLPCILMAMFNTGLQANLALDPAKAAQLGGWRHAGLPWYQG